MVHLILRAYSLDVCVCARARSLTMSWLRRILGLRSRVKLVGTDLNGNQYLEVQAGGTCICNTNFVILYVHLVTGVQAAEDHVEQ